MSLITIIFNNVKNTATHFKSSTYILQKYSLSSDNKTKKPSARLEEFRKKLRETTPIQELDELTGPHPFGEKEPLPPWPNNTNPHTGEIGGPRGPEPTRYGDWERKGRVSDF